MPSRDIPIESQPTAVSDANYHRCALVDEAYSPSQAFSNKQTCPTALTNADDLAEFGKGVIVGAINGTEGFIEFMAKPNSVNNALGAMGDALGTAGKYYADKALTGKLTDIGTDAGEATKASGAWLEDYSRKRPIERGTICGQLATDWLLAEATFAGAAKMVKSSEPFFAPVARESKSAIALESKSLASENFFTKLVANEKFANIAGFTSSPEFAASINEAIDALPTQLQRFLKEAEVDVIPVGRIGEAMPKHDAAQGLFFTREGKRYVLISEETHLSATAAHPKLTLRHELTHALDHAGGWHSDQPWVVEAFEKDFAHVDPAFKEFLLETLGKGNPATLRKEIVAELASRRAVPDADGYDAFFRANFPNLDTRIHEPGSPFSM